MPSLTQFRGAFRGGTRQNRFEIEATTPSGNISTYHATALSIPAQIVDEIPVDFQGRRVYIPGDKDNPQWTLTILDDIGNSAWSDFQDWINQIASPSENESDLGPVAGRKNWSVRHLSTDGVVIKTAELVGCWPTQVGAIQLSNSQRNTLVTFDVTIRYDYWKTGLASSPSNSTPLSGS